MQYGDVCPLSQNTFNSFNSLKFFKSSAGQTRSGSHLAYKQDHQFETPDLY